MSGRPSLLERWLGADLGSVSPRRRDWLRAALAELSAVPDGQQISWWFGIAAIAVGDLLEQSFLPWRREAGARPPAGFAALTSLVLLAVPLGLIAMSAAAGRLWLPALAAAIVSALAILLALWVNLAAVLRAQPLGGLIYAVSLRALPLNLLALGLAVAIAAAALRLGIL